MVGGLPPPTWLEWAEGDGHQQGPDRIALSGRSPGVGPKRLGAGSSVWIGIAMWVLNTHAQTGMVVDPEWCMDSGPGFEVGVDGGDTTSLGPLKP